MDVVASDGREAAAWTAAVVAVAALVALAVAGPVGYLLFEEPLWVVGAVLRCTTGRWESGTSRKRFSTENDGPPTAPTRS